MNSRRFFLKRAALFAPTIFIPRLIRAQTILTAEGAAIAAKKKSAPSGGGGGDTPFITSYVAGTVKSGATFDGGFMMTPAVNMTVTALGRLKLSGNGLSHTVYLRNSGCSNLASALVDLSLGAVGDYIYSPITPVTLNSGTSYNFHASETNSGDTYLDDNTTVVSTTDGAVTFSDYKDTSCHVSKSGLHAFGIPNFLYHL